MPLDYISHSNDENRSNVIMLPLKLGGKNAPRVDVSMLKMIGSTFEGTPREMEYTNNIFAGE